MLVHPIKMAASGVSLFQATCLNQYRELLQTIHPGEGITDKMLPSSAHGAKFEIDNRLTYKVNKMRRGKTTKTKKVVNLNLMFTMFTAFGEKSPDELHKDMVEWIESNCESFKNHMFMAMVSHDIDFNTWLSKVKSNDFIGDEFCLSTLCQMCQRHALVVTLTKVWTTIPPSFQNTNDEIRRLCDIHLLYVCKDTYTMLKSVFEWKREVPIGEISLLTPDPSEPLKDTTDTVLKKESSDQNVVEIKHETDLETAQVQDQLGLINIPSLPNTDHPLLDATVNLLVDLPGVDLQGDLETPMDATPVVPTHDEEGEPTDSTHQPTVTGDDERVIPSHVVQPVQNPATSIPCSIVLKDVSVKLKGKTSVVFPPPEEEMCKAKVCLQTVDRKKVVLPRLRGRKRQKPSDNCPARKAKNSVKYVFTDATAGEDSKTEKSANILDRSAPSGYRLAAHKYMVAKKKGLIEGPRTRTRALKITKKSQETSGDSEETIDYLSDSAPPPKKRKHVRRPTSQGTLVTKTFVLRKNGKGTQPSKNHFEEKEKAFLQKYQMQQTLQKCPYSKPAFQGTT